MNSFLRVVLVSVMSVILAENISADAVVVKGWPDGSDTAFPIEKMRTISDLLAKIDLPRDRLLIMFREAHVDVQEKALDECVAVVEKKLVEERHWLFHSAARVEALVAIKKLLSQARATGKILDYMPLDQLRFAAESNVNRKLRGNDQFIVSERMDTIWVWTAHQQLLELPHSPGKSAAEYIYGLHAHVSDRRGIAYWIGPRGDSLVLGYASHNKSSKNIPPGSLLFVPPSVLGPKDQSVVGCTAEILRFQNIHDMIQTNRPVY